MNNYVSSANIKVFPASDRGSDYKISALTTENNLTQFIRSIYPKNNGSFVISADKTSFTAPFDFVIRGYYFSITATTSLGYESGPVYAHVCILTADETLSNYKKLGRYDGDSSPVLDASGTFYGLYLTATADPVNPPQGYTEYILQLWDGSKVPESSKFYLKTTEIRNNAAGTELLSEKISTGDVAATGNGSFGGTLGVTGNTTLGANITAANIGTSTAVANNSLVVNSSGEFKKVDLSSSAVTATADTTASFTYVDDFTQNKNGRVDRTRRTTTVANGVATAASGDIGTAGQSTFKVNNAHIKVYGLGTTDSPTFANITDSGLDASKAVITDSNKKFISRTISDSTSAASLSSSSTNFVTERDVYYGLPTVNNAHNYTAQSTLYAPVTGGSAGGVLYATGSTSTPAWTAAGSSGQVLKSAAAGAPVWESQANLSVGEAGKLVNSADAGSSTTPVYFSNGVPVAVSSIASSLLPVASNSQYGAAKIYVGNNGKTLYIEL